MLIIQLYWIKTQNRMTHRIYFFLAASATMYKTQIIWTRECAAHEFHHGKTCRESSLLTDGILIKSCHDCWLFLPICLTLSIFAIEISWFLPNSRINFGFTSCLLLQSNAYHELAQLKQVRQKLTDSLSWSKIKACQWHKW